tara:strand:- start:6357 stop:7127 length:771 start_codon:yes stop_codon:yes gene_type:complete
MKVQITVDTNAAERSLSEHVRDELATSSLMSATSAGCIQVDLRRLDLGDVQLECGDVRLVIERKTAVDLASSITDGRYREQKLRMLAPPMDDMKTSYAYVIESRNILNIDPGGQVGRIPELNVCAALLKTALRDRIPVIMSSGSLHTARLVVYLARQLSKGGLALHAAHGVAPIGLYTDAVKKRKRDNLQDVSVLYETMLIQVPGMSPSKARAVAGVFPSMRSLMDASVSDVAAVACGNSRRVGPILAARIVRLLQ